MQKILYIPIDTLIDNTVECTKLVKRGDTITLQIKVFSNGSLADLTGQSIDLILRKSDNTIIEKTITSVANGVITVVLTEQATLSVGLVSGEIQIYNSTSHIGTNTFTFNVSNSIADDVLAKSENEIETLIDLKTVIDSNNATISEYVSNITQIAGTAESVQALAGTKLYIDTNLEDLQQANAEAVINIVNENTQNDEATSNIADLTTLNNTANTLNIDLESNIAIGTILNDDIEGNMTTGGILNSDLEANITDGTTTKTNLDSSIATGNTLKTNIDSENVRAEANITAMQGFGDVTQLTQNVTALKTEVENARNGEVSLDARLDKNDVAVANITTDLSDVTNKLDKVFIAPSNETFDFNLATEGIHFCTSECTNMPTTGAFGLLEVKKRSDAFVFQRFTTVAGSTFTRTINDGVLTNWKRITTEYLETWNTVVLQNGWSADSSIGIQYFKHSGIVYLNIRLNTGTISAETVIGTLPEGYRPITNVIVPLLNSVNGTVNYITVLTSGNITVSLTATFTTSSLVIGTMSYRGDI